MARSGGLAAIGNMPFVRLSRLVGPGMAPPGTHRIEGGGIGFVPPQLSLDELDEVVAVSTGDATAMARRATREDGVRSGPSTGANIAAALALALRPGEGARVATVQVDSRLKYLAGELYS